MDEYGWMWAIGALSLGQTDGMDVDGGSRIIFSRWKLLCWSAAGQRPTSVWLQQRKEICPDG